MGTITEGGGQLSELANASPAVKVGTSIIS